MIEIAVLPALLIGVWVSGICHLSEVLQQDSTKKTLLELGDESDEFREVANETAVRYNEILLDGYLLDRIQEAGPYDYPEPFASDLAAYWRSRAHSVVNPPAGRIRAVWDGVRSDSNGRSRAEDGGVSA